MFHFSSKVSTITLECNDCGEEFEVPKKSDRITCKCPFCANILFIGSKGFAEDKKPASSPLQSLFLKKTKERTPSKQVNAPVKDRAKEILPGIEDWTPKDEKNHDFIFSPDIGERNRCARCERFSEDESKCEWCGFVFHKIEDREAAPFSDDMRKGFEKVLQTSKIEKSYFELRQKPYMWDTHSKFIRTISQAGAWGSGMVLVDRLSKTSMGDEQTIRLLSKTRMILQQGASISGEFKDRTKELEAFYPRRSFIRWAIYFFVGAFLGSVLFLFLLGR